MSSILDDLVRALLVEAGYGDDAVTSGSLGILLHHAQRSRFEVFPAEAVSARCRAVLAMLQQCNMQINGPDPENRQSRLESIRADLAYAVAEIIGPLAEALHDALRLDRPKQEVRLLSEAVIVITHAWSQLLAGDIGDVVESARKHHAGAEFEFETRLAAGS